MRWFHQIKNYGLGNFVMATPALQLLYEKNKEKVNVFFNDEYICELYRSAYFLNILSKKPKNPPFGTSMRPKKRRSKETDSEALCRKWVEKGYRGIPNTYVDNVNVFTLPRVDDRKYVAVFHGCLTDRRVRVMEKDIGYRNRQCILDFLLSHNFTPVLLGTTLDYRQFWKNVQIPSLVVNYIGNLSIGESVSVLNQCDYFASNDTGMYHVAGALKKEGIVFWKDTNMIKNRSTYTGIKHVSNKSNSKEIVLNNLKIFFAKKIGEH